MKTLLVEDDATTRTFLNDLLTAMGLEVTACEDAEAGMRAYERAFYPLVVLDWLMPLGQMDGLQLCRSIRSSPQGHETHILVITVKDHPEDLDAVLEAGADDYVPKPVTAEALRIRLRIAERRLRDVLARNTAETELLVSQARLQTVVANAPIVLFVISRNGVFTFAEGKGLAALGLTPSEVVGQSVFDLYRGVPDIAAHVSRALGGEEFTAEIEIGRVSLESWYAPLPQEQGAIIVSTDITQRKKAERELREGDERFRRFAEAAFEGIAVMEDGKIIDANPQIAEILGVRPEAVVGHPFVEYIHPTEQNRAKAYFIEQRATPFGLRAVRPDGSELLLEVRVRPLPYEGRDVLVVAVQDVTTKRRTEDEHRRLEEQFRQAQKMESLGVLAGGIAHDFNNLLMGVLGNASLALMDVPAESPAADHIQQIEASAQRAADLTNQMLAFSGKGKFVVARVNLSTFIEQQSAMLRTAVPESVELQLRLDEDLPDVEADTTQLRQILINLLTNAGEAIGLKAGIVRISTGVRRVTKDAVRSFHTTGDMQDGYRVYLEVRDNGSGMDETTLARVFDPFFTTKFTGRGLGMAAVSGIVRGHRGAIRIASQPGTGTTVTVLFPPYETETVEEREESAEAEPTAVPTQQLILVVDDEETVRTVTSKMLERAGYAVVTANDGQEAVTTFEARAGEIAGVLLDLTMPDMNGDQVYERLRRIDGSVRVVLMSGYDEQEATGEFGGQGLAGFLQKPFSAKQLSDKVRDAFGPDHRRPSLTLETPDEES